MADWAGSHNLWRGWPLRLAGVGGGCTSRRALRLGNSLVHGLASKLLLPNALERSKTARLAVDLVLIAVAASGPTCHAANDLG